MASTYTGNLQIQQPGINDASSSNLWGGFLNTDFQMIDDAVAGIYGLTVTSTTTVLTQTAGVAFQNGLQAHYNVSGTPGAAATVLLPAGKSRTFSATNNLSGGFNLIFGSDNGGGVAAGNTVTITPGNSAILYSDGTNVATRVTAASFGALLAANNLSDLSNVTTARTNLGVSATGADTTYAFRANNLSDLANAATARSNLGVAPGTGLTQSGTTLQVTYGTTVGTAAQGNDSRITGALQASSNLSDVANPTTARTNIGALAATATGIPQQGYYGTISGTTLTQRSAFGGISVVRNSAGNYTITLGSTVLNMGAVFIYAVAPNGLGDGQIATPTTQGPFAANGSVTFNVRNASSKTVADASELIIFAY